MLLLFAFSIVLASCQEKVLPKPDNLVEKEKMIAVLTDFALANAAKSVNATRLKEVEIDPTAFVLQQHGLDSLQFVESDRYYASLPAEYEKIYSEVEQRIEAMHDKFQKQEGKRDSIARSKNNSKK